MSAKHTPGPWKASAAGCFVDAEGRPTTTPQEFHVDPIMCTLRVGNASAERRANDARLIAAAPDLLKALRDLEISANTVNRCYSHNPANFAVALAGLKDSAEAARAAIAKAEDRS